MVQITSFGAAGRPAARSIGRGRLIGLLLGGCALASAAPALAQSAAAGAGPDTASGGIVPAQQTAPAQTVGAAGDRAQPASSDDIVVTGIRASLASSLDTKRRAQNFVDSISAEEAGKFPDNNLAESLQRVAGVTVVRSFGLGQQISVRGLGPDFQNVLLNGRSLPSDTGAYSADGGGRGRSFNFDVLPSEMISRVDVNKTAMPSLTEGGIGSTIDIVTPRPLDSGKNFATLVVTGNTVTRRRTVTPTVVGIGSWANQAGTFGLALSGSYTNLLASRDSVRVDQWDGLPRSDGQPQSTFNVITGTGTELTASKRAFTAPRQMSYAQLTGGTQRYFVGGTAQFRPTPAFTLTADGFYSHLDQQITESNVHPIFGNTMVNPDIGTDGVLRAGIFPGQAYLSSPAAQSAIAAYNVAHPTDPITVAAPQALSVIRERDRKATSYQIGLNGKWTASDTLDIEGDLSYSKATGDKPFDPYVLIGRYSQSDVGFQLDGNRNPVATLTDPVYSNASLVRVGYSGNWRQTIDDHILEGRLSGLWHVDNGLLRGIGVGADYQDHRKGLDNYHNYANPYDGLTFAPDPSLLDIRSFGNFLNGTVASPVGSYFGYDPRQFINYLSQPAQLAQCSNDCGKTYPPLPYSLVFDRGGSFDTREKVTAGYIDTKWGGAAWSANVGVRVVHVQTTSSGFAGALQSAVPTGSGSYQITSGAGQPVSSNASYTSVLPSGNLKVNATDTLVLRLAASRTLTRADLNDLRYGLYFGGSVPTFTLSAGNPGLKPQYGNNYDIAAEWYLSKVSYLSVAGFRKDLSNLFDTRVYTAPTAQFAPGVTNVPATVLVSQISNVSKGRVQGVEAAAQFALDDRAGWASGFGVSGNYTYVDAAARNATQCFAGVSPNSYNASGFYDNGKLQLRAAYNWRSAWTTACSWDVTGKPQRNAAYGQVDLSFRSNLTDSLQLFADVVNLTNSRNRLFILDNVPVQVELNYRRIDFGARLSF